MREVYETSIVKYRADEALRQDKEGLRVHSPPVTTKKLDYVHSSEASLTDIVTMFGKRKFRV